MKRFGSGITERSKPDCVPATPQTLRTYFAEFNANLRTPWGGYRDLIAQVRTRLADIKAAAPSLHDDLDGYNRLFVERTTEAWYLDAIDVAAKVAEIAVEQARPWQAVACAMRIGELLTELRMKHLWEAHALRGQKIHNRGVESRKGQLTRAERVEAVDALHADGVKKGAAFAAVAEREGVTAKAIETDYYKARRKAS